MRPAVSVGLLIECICIRVNEDTPDLVRDESADDLADLRLILRKAEEKMQLAGAVAKPHCRDVTGDDKYPAVLHDLDGLLQRVRNTGPEDLRDPTVLRKALCYPPDRFVD